MTLVVFTYLYTAKCKNVREDIFCTVTQASQAELMVMTVSEIVRCLIEAHEEGKDVNLNRQVFLHIRRMGDTSVWFSLGCFVCQHHFVVYKLSVSSDQHVPASFL